MPTQNIKNLDQTIRLLKKRRKELGITQTDLAKYCDLSRSGISQIELGVKDIRFSTLVKICKILGFKIQIQWDD